MQGWGTASAEYTKKWEQLQSKRVTMGKIVEATGSPSASASKKRIFKKPRTARTCNNVLCNKNPYFGWHGEKAMFCVTHKETGMVDVKNKRCEDKDCMKRGLFGYEREGARFCSRHRLEGMVDLKNKRCKWVGCAQQANFAQPGKLTAIFCVKHKTTGMVDVKGPRCATMNCVKVAGYGVKGNSPSACLLHRAPGMVEMKQQRPSRLPRRRLPATNSEKPLDLGDFDADDVGDTTCPLPKPTEVNVPGARDLPDDAKSSSATISPTSGLDPCSGLDVLRYPDNYQGKAACNPSVLPQQQLYLKHGNHSSEPSAKEGSIIGNNSSSSSINGQDPRAWKLWTRVSKAATGDSSVPTANTWALGGQACGSKGGNSGGLQQATTRDIGSSRATSHFPTSAPYHQPSETVSTTIPVREFTGLSALHRAGADCDDLLGDGRAGVNASEWRSTNSGENVQQQLSAVSAAMDQQPELSEMYSVGDGEGHGREGIYPSLLSGSVGRNEQEAMSLEGLNIPEVEAVDAWLRALMQGDLTREGPDPALQQHQQDPRSHSFGGVARDGFGEHTRHVGNLHPMGLGSTTSTTTSGSYHSVQQPRRQSQHQHHTPLGPSVSLGNVGRTNRPDMVVAPPAPTVSLGAATAAAPARGRSPSMGSMGSCDAPPPNAPVAPGGVLPTSRQGFLQHDVTRGRCTGGASGAASRVTSRRAKTCGVESSTGPYPSQLPATGVLSGILSSGGSQRFRGVSLGHGSGGFSSNIYSSSRNVLASPAWGAGF